MASAWAWATIEQFEQVSLENGTELFRVSARGHVDDDPDPGPVLECGVPGDPHTYEPLSSGGDRRGLLRVAYAVPSSLIDASGTFALRLPDGNRIELPRPTAGPSRADERRGRRVDDASWRPSELGSPPAAPAGGDPTPQRIRDLEQEREQLQRRVDEVTREHTTLRSERDEALRQAGAAQARHGEALQAAASARGQRDKALHENEVARAQRDAALREAESARRERDEALRAASAATEMAQAATSERDSVLEATAAARAEHERLLRRLRQNDARFELLRADTARTEATFGAGSTVRLRRLEAEHEQIAGHIRALAELVAANARLSDRYATLNGTAERVAAVRDRAVSAAHEQAERDLERMLADTSG